MISISKDNYEKILAHAEKNLPEEACGLIAGEVTAEGKVIREVYLLTNIDHSNEHFSLDPKEHFHQGYSRQGLETAGQLAFASGIAVASVARR